MLTFFALSTRETPQGYTRAFARLVMRSNSFDLFLLNLLKDGLFYQISLPHVYANTALEFTHFLAPADDTGTPTARKHGASLPFRFRLARECKWV